MEVETKAFSFIESSSLAGFGLGRLLVGPKIDRTAIIETAIREAEKTSLRRISIRVFIDQEAFQGTGEIDIVAKIQLAITGEDLWFQVERFEWFEIK
jgi:hypothetical protein